jgi:hypothetical protein
MKDPVEFPARVRGAVRYRAGDRCEVCLIRRIDHIHHKLLRSAGGKGVPENALGVCHSCHTYIHANPEKSYEMGWLVHAGPVNMGQKQQ